MPMTPADSRPRLRPVEVVRARSDDQVIALRDPSGQSPHVISVSRATLFILSKLDGQTDVATIQASFMRRFGRMLFSRELDELLRHLDEALFLHGPRLEEHLAQQRAAYAARPLRPAIIKDCWGDDADAQVRRILNGTTTPARREGRLAGFVAPHLDYARGLPCYAAAYADLASRTDAIRFVILGTNHFGSRCDVVGTHKDFETRFGAARCDRSFMIAMNRALGVDLCEGELDHAREHSVELQVHLLAHVLAGREFTIVPFLCPDPCGPTGTRPRDGRGADLREFAMALGRLAAEDSTPTCIIAGADLSHVGAYFDDDTPLDAESMRELERADRAALVQLERGGAEAFRESVAATGNATHICSVGCIYALATALQGRAVARLRQYHQALTREVENCVSCAAIDFVAT